MSEAGSAADRDRTDIFRHDPRALRPAILLVAILLLLVLAAVLVGPGYDPDTRDPLWAALAIGFLAVLLAGLIWMNRNRPALLRVGPEGIDMPLGFARPLSWQHIHRIRRLRESRALFQRRVWVVIDPAPGVLPERRMQGPRRIELWLMARWGLRIPLHALDARPEVVIGSIERFRPVAPPD